MTRDQWLEKLTHNQDAVKFFEIPVAFLDSEIIQQWLKSSSGNLGDIPTCLVDDDIRRIAVQRPFAGGFVNDFALGWMRKEDTEIYDELVLLSLKQSSQSMAHVDPSLYSEAFFLKALEVNPESLLSSSLEWPEWTEAMIDSAVSKDPRYLKSFKPEQIKRECVEQLIQRPGVQLHELVKAGLTGIMIEVMREGLWWSCEPKPPDLASCLDRLTTSLHALYLAYAKIFPMEEVLPLLDKPERQELLHALYTHEELMSHLHSGLLKKNKLVKGWLLEDGMGL